MIFCVYSGYVLRNEVSSLIRDMGENDMAFFYEAKQLPLSPGQRIEFKVTEKADVRFLQGGFLIIRNTKYSRLFMEKWLAFCVDVLLWDAVKKQFSYPFKGADQTCLSILAYLHPEGIQLADDKEEPKRRVVIVILEIIFRFFFCYIFLFKFLENPAALSVVPLSLLLEERKK